jgi:hypothetical protein
MKCNKCGQDIPDNATFCTNCGNKIEQPQQNPNPNVQQANQVPNQNPQANQNSQANPMPNQNPQVNNGMPNQQPQFNQNPQFNQAPNRNPQFNGMPNQNVPYGNKVPQQNVKTEPSPILTWFNSAKDVFLDFFKKGYIEKPTTLLTEKNHMWLVFAVGIVILGILGTLFSIIGSYGASATFAIIFGIYNPASKFFAFGTMVYVIAKIVKNNKVSYINALNATSGAYVPIVFSLALNCIFNLIHTQFINAQIVTYAATVADVIFIVLLLGVIEKVAEGSKYEKSLWFKSLSIAGAYIAYKIAALILDAIFAAIFYGTDHTSLASLVYGGASIFS